MERIKSVLLLFLFMGLIPVSFTGCNRCGCDSYPSKQDAIIKSISVSSLGYFSVTDTVDGYPFDSVLLLISATDFDIINKKFSFNFPNFAFSQKLYACEDCAFYTQTITLNYIASIKITSKIDIIYNDTIQIQNGELLNNIFDVKLEYPKQTFSIKDFLNTNKKPTYNYNERDVSLFLNSKPLHPIILLFDVEITLSDGKVFMFKNEQFNVK